MTVLIPEAASVVGSTAEGATAYEGAAAKARKAAPAKKAVAKKAPAPRARKAPAPVVQRSKGSQRRSGTTLKAPKAPKAFNLTGAGKGGAAHKLVIAEFILVVVLIGISPIFTRKPSGGHVYVANDFVRLSAACLLFFVLALLSNSPRSSRFAAAFGALVLLGTLFNSTQAITAIANIFVAAGTGQGKITGIASGKSKITVPTFNPTDPSSNPQAKSPSYGGGSAVPSGPGQSPLPTGPLSGGPPTGGNAGGGMNEI